MADEKNFENENEEVKETPEIMPDADEETAEETAQEAVQESLGDETAQFDVPEDAETSQNGEIAEDVEVPEAIEGQEPQMSETEKAVAEALAQRDAEDADKKSKAKKRNAIIAVIVAAVVVIGGVVTSGFVSKSSTGGLQINTYSGWLPKLVNKYNHKGYVDVTGNTLGDIVNQLGITKEEFLEMYSLPADMPLSTMEMAIVYTMPASAYAEMLGGVDFDTMKEILNIPDTTEDGVEITGDTEWGIAEGEIAVGDYIGGEENLEEFLESYEISDENITAETKWKEIRNTVDSYQKKQRAEAAAAAAEEEEAEDITVTSTEAPDDAQSDTDAETETEAEADTDTDTAAE